MPALHPLTPLRYTAAVAGPLGDLVAPPYDVIDAAERDALRARSPFNAVHLELPDPPYDRVGALIDSWVAAGALARPHRPGVVAWTQAFTLDDGSVCERHVILGAVGAEPYATRQVRPHERTHAGPKADRLALLHGAGHQISPVYGLYPDAGGAVWAALAPTGAPDVEFTGSDGTRNRIWWVDDGEAIATAADALATRWILIADGHHRYETAVRYAEERRAAGAAADGPHDLVMMGLTAIDDPGLVVLPTHRVLAALPTDDTWQSAFTLQPVADLGELRAVLAASSAEVPTFGFVTSSGAAVLSAEAPPADASPAARLDVAVLERQVLVRGFGRDQAELAHDGVLSYVKDTADAWRLGSSGVAAGVFILRDMPKAAVVAVAEAGETMPQKSTYFFPKLPTGVAFHPLS